MNRHPRRSTLFPYTTLFRSGCGPSSVGFVQQRIERRGIDERRHDRGHLGEVLGEVLVVLDAHVGKAGSEAAAFNRLHGSDRKSTRLNSSHLVISYAVFCLKK